MTQEMNNVTKDHEPGNVEKAKERPSLAPLEGTQPF